MPTKLQYKNRLLALVQVCERVLEESHDENDCRLCGEPVQEGPGVCGEDCPLSNLVVALQVHGDGVEPSTKGAQVNP